MMEVRHCKSSARCQTGALDGLRCTSGCTRTWTCRVRHQHNYGRACYLALVSYVVPWEVYTQGSHVLFHVSSPALMVLFLILDQPRVCRCMSKPRRRVPGASPGKTQGYSGTGDDVRIRNTHNDTVRTHFQHGVSAGAVARRSATLPVPHPLRFRLLPSASP